MSYELDRLRAYVKKKLPMLNEQMATLHRDDVRQVFNAALGMRITPADAVSESAIRFLVALEQADEAGKLYLDVLPKALAKVKELRVA